MQLFLDIDTRKLSLPNGGSVASLKFSYPDKYPVTLTVVASGVLTTIANGDAVFVLKKPKESTFNIARSTAAFVNANFVKATLDLGTVEADAYLPSVGSCPLAFEVSVIWGSSEVTSLPIPVIVERRAYDATRPAPTNTTSYLATQQEAEDGTSNVKWMSPLRTFQAIMEETPEVSIVTTTHVANGVSKTYTINGLASTSPDHVLILANGITQSPTKDYTVDFATGKITFISMPPNGMGLVFRAFGLRSVQRPIDPTLYTYAFDLTSDGLTAYYGRLLNADRPPLPALPETSSQWAIRRSALTAAGRVSAVTNATGTWSNRTGLAYV